VMVFCGLSCRRDSPQIVFDHAYQAFLRGDLKRSQGEAHAAYERFRDYGTEWPWRFRILEAKSLLWQGMYAETLAFLNSQPTQPGKKDSLVEILAIKGGANARLHDFPRA